MARQLKIRKNLRCFLDEESKMVDQVDDEGEDLIDAVTGEKVREEEMVPVVRIIGKEYPEPEEGTIFHLALMRFADAMKFNSLETDKRAQALDDYAPMSIRGWERMLDDDDNDIDFKKEYIEYIDTIDRLHLVMCSVMQSLGGAKGKG